MYVILSRLQIAPFVHGGLLWCALATAILGSFAIVSPAAAIDCAKAQTRIERTICSEETLKRKDTEFARGFFTLLRSLTINETSPERETLLADQRDWLKRRETECAESEASAFRRCIVSSIELRRKQLDYEWGALDEDQDLSKKKELLVGDATLVVGASCPHSTSEYGLFYMGKVIACGSHGLYNEPPFVVERRLRNGKDEAALLVSHDGGQMNCSRFYILSVEKRGDLHVQEFGRSCLVPTGGNIDVCEGVQQIGHGELCEAPEGGGSAFRVGQSFRFLREATAASAGEQLEWDWKAGFSRATLTYAPKGGDNMDDLVNAKPSEHKNPLENGEFYKAVNSLPASDRRDFLASLSGLYKGCECEGPVDYKLYGLRNSHDVYSMSGCGIYLEGYYVRCSGPDALAVWEKRSRKFYFAIVHGGQNGKRQPPSDVHAFPPIDSWSDIALNQLRDWQKNVPWESRD